MKHDEVTALMHIAEKVRVNHPGLKHIHNHAIKRLAEIDEELGPVEELHPAQLQQSAAPVTIGEPGRATTSGTSAEAPIQPDPPFKDPQTGQPVMQPPPEPSAAVPTTPAGGFVAPKPEPEPPADKPAEPAEGSPSVRRV